MDIINIITNLYIDNSYNNKENFLNCFKLPIEYLENTKLELNNNIINDLELKSFKNDISNSLVVNNKSISNKDISYNYYYNKNLYNSVFNPLSIFEKELLDRWSKFYTNNINFLLDSQELLKTFNNTNNDINNNTNNNTNNDINNNTNNDTNNEIYFSCESLFYDNGFLEKFHFIDIPMFQKYNNNSLLLQGLSIYNLSSPLMTILIPIIFLIIPFILIKLQGHKITLEMYLSYLQDLFQNHILGQVFMTFSNADFSTKLYLIISIGFYFFQFYLNIVSCKKFYNNIEDVNQHDLQSIQYFLKHYKDWEQNKFITIGETYGRTRALEILEKSILLGAI